MNIVMLVVSSHTSESGKKVRNLHFFLEGGTAYTVRGSERIAETLEVGDEYHVLNDLSDEINTVERVVRGESAEFIRDMVDAAYAMGGEEMATHFMRQRLVPFVEGFLKDR